MSIVRQSRRLCAVRTAPRFSAASDLRRDVAVSEEKDVAVSEEEDVTASEEEDV